jgi:hypothetical protein
MLDFNNLPTNQKVDRQVFYANTPSSVSQNWVAWLKPRGVNFIKILCLAGGGGGGGGFANNGVIGAGGGAGGNSSSQSIIIFPAWLLPDLLYVSVGVGGAGGLTSTTGSSGVNSYVAIYENTTANNLLTYATAGAGGNAAYLGGGTTSPSVASTAANAYISIMGQAFASTAGNIGLAGQSGATGNAFADGTNITFPATGLIVTGGAGGGGYGTIGNPGFNGGGITGVGSPFPVTTIGGSAGDPVNTAGGDGGNGYQIIPNLTYFIGGMGGGGAGVASSGSTLSDIGGKGGKGSYGCGGGGGGGSFTGTTGGLGGDGGDGLVIITSW